MRYQDKETCSFTDKHMFDEKATNKNTKPFRDELYGQFNRQIGLLLESKRPRKENSVKGRLNTRLAYRHPFSDTIFSKHQHIPSSDTTIVILLDGSGSMDACAGLDNNLTRIETCNAICSAFAKSVRNVLGDKLKLEIFVKSAPAVSGANMGIKGSFPTLTRVYSNANSMKGDYEKLLNLTCRSPLTFDGRSIGSYTAEYSVLPALFDWVKDNITTKNMVILNMTDGESYVSLGEKEYNFGNEGTSALGNKYLRGVSNLTFLIGNDLDRKEMNKIYGNNIVTSDKGEFVSPLFRTLIRLIDQSVE